MMIFRQLAVLFMLGFASPLVAQVALVDEAQVDLSILGYKADADGIVVQLRLTNASPGNICMIDPPVIFLVPNLA